MPPSVSVPTVPFAPPDIGDAEIAAVSAVLRSGWLTTGPQVEEFERRFAAYTHAPHAIALSSCTAALQLSLHAAGIGPGDEVVTTPLTFCATANVIVHSGATPVFADVEPDTGNLDPSAAAAVTTAATRALMPVHYGGHPADVLAFETLASRHGIVVIEDAAHCIEGVAQGRKIGSIADFTCFSFYATKNLTTGEGGMVTTRSAEAAERIRVGSRHGLSSSTWTRENGGARPAYDMEQPGFKANMTDVQAAIGLCQLERIQAMHARRQAICARYDEGLRGLVLGRRRRAAAGTVEACHLYTVRVNPRECGVTRDGLHATLRDRGISASVHFPAVHLLAFYRQRFGLRRGMFPHAEAIADETLSLPLSSALTDDDVDYVIETMRHVLG
jgi:dTDP-4-amino-4,6-dideoxygalactose transaminase